MTIVPDDKDWTWVLRQACPDCGYVAADVDRHAVADGVRATAARWQALLAHPRVAVRPTDGQWSALEYGCHVRDVFTLGDVRIGRMLNEEHPSLQNWDQDATALEERYAEQDPAAVGPQLLATAEVLATLLEGVPDDGWARAGTRTDGAVFTVESFARYVLHDPVHHEWDAAQGYLALD